MKQDLCCSVLCKPTSIASSYTATYDAWNRLVKLMDGANTVQDNQYDGLRRRTVKRTYTAGTLTQTRDLFYSVTWQVLEERIGTSAAERQFVWGLRHIDELVLRDRDTNADGSLDERLYALQDPNWNVVAIADNSGNVQERNVYDAYGMLTVLTPAFGGRLNSSYDWETTYAGYRLDRETALSIVRNRLYHPRLAQWLQRDPVESDVRGSLYAYVSSMALSEIDPLGLESNWETLQDIFTDRPTLPPSQGTLGPTAMEEALTGKISPHRNFEMAADCPTEADKTATVRRNFPTAVETVHLGKEIILEFESQVVTGRLLRGLGRGPGAGCKGLGQSAKATARGASSLKSSASSARRMRRLGGAIPGKPVYVDYDNSLLRFLKLKKPTYPNRRMWVDQRLSGDLREAVLKHERQHIGDFAKFPELTHLSQRGKDVYFPGAATSRYFLEYRGYQQQMQILGKPMRLTTPLNSFSLKQKLHLGADAGIVTGGAIGGAAAANNLYDWLDE